MSAVGGTDGVRVDDATFLDVQHFLHAEARLLDEERYDDWLELLSEDIDYRMPLTMNRERGARSSTASDMEVLQESIHSLRFRIERLKTDYAWAEDPPSRTVHMVTNLLVTEGATGDEVNASSCFCVHWVRGSSPVGDFFVGRRADVLVRGPGGGWLLRERELVLDNTTLSANGVTILF